MSLETATIHSVNVVYAQLMRDLGPAQVAATAHLLGIRSKLPLHCSMVLGADDVTPLELTSAYATIAAGGVYHRPRVIRRVRGRRTGKIVADNAFKVQAKRVVSEGVAVRDDEDPRAGRDRPAPGTRARLDDGRPQAGKTGTAENYGNAWFCGYTPDIASCVWVGYRSLEQAAREHRGRRRGLRRHAPGGDLEGLHDDGDAAPAAARLARSPSSRWSTGDFKTTTSFGYNPAPPAPPAAPRRSRSRSRSRTAPPRRRRRS